MSKTRTDGDPAEPAEAIAVPGLKPVALGFPAAVEAVKTNEPSRVFRDKVFTSRTLILPCGGTLAVVAGRVVACGDDHYAFLKAHPELEQLPE